MEFFDSHAHYNEEKFKDDREQVLKEIYESGVTKLISSGYDIPSSKMAIDISSKHKNFVYPVCGISPNDIANNELDIVKQVEEIKNLAINYDVLAIGEIGLDYYWNKENKELEKQAFIYQIKLAKELNKPIVIHTREAIYDTLDILKNVVKPDKCGVFHCCPLNKDLVSEGLKLGFYISCAGPVTFKNSKNANEIIKLIPLDRILIETDSPYLSPEPNRGRRNDSRNVKYIAQKIAEVKGISLEEVAKATYQNAANLFNIKEKNS